MGALRILLCLVLIHLSTSDAQCPSGWEYNNGFCYNAFYYHYYSNRDYFRRLCLTHNSHLASVQSTDEQTFLSDYLSRKISSNAYVFIGLGARAGDGKLVYDDGREYKYQNWDVNQPAISANDDCTAMYTSRTSINVGKWISRPCSYQAYYNWGLCKRPQNSACGPGWYYYQRNCYIFEGTKVNWPTADNTCKQKHHAELLYLANEKETGFINRWVAVRAGWGAIAWQWIGLNDRELEGMFMWSSQDFERENVDFENWRPNEPLSGADVDCVTMWKSAYGYSADAGKWRATVCTTPLQFVCKRKAGPGFPAEDTPTAIRIREHQTDRVSNVVCGSNTMTFALDKSLAPEDTYEQLTLNDPSCTPTTNSTHYLFVVNYHACGTELRDSGDDIVFSNRIAGHPKRNHDDNDTSGDGDVSGPPTPAWFSSTAKAINISLDCKIAKTVVAVITTFDEKYDYGVVVDVRNPTDLQVDDIGILSLGIGLFGTNGYDSAVPFGLTPSIEVRNRVFFAIDVNTRARLIVRAARCWVSPGKYNDLHIPQFTIIKDGCPVLDDVQVHPVPLNVTQYRFSFESFAIKGYEDYALYVHCTARVCTANNPDYFCTKSCSSRRRRRQNDKPLPADTLFTLSTSSGFLVRSSPDRVQPSQTIALAQSGACSFVQQSNAMATFFLMLVICLSNVILQSF